MNGFAWSDDAIFAVWLSHPQYFNSYNGTSLAAVNQLLKPQLHEAVIAGPGVQPNFCWRETNGKGHFEAIKHRQQKSDHECFVIVKQSTAESPMDVAPKIRIHRQKDTRNSNVVRYFGSTAETTPWWTLSIERPSPHSFVLCGMISFGILLATLILSPLSTVTEHMVNINRRTNAIFWCLAGISTNTLLNIGWNSLNHWRNHQSKTRTNIPGVICIEGNLGSGKSTLLSDILHLTRACKNTLEGTPIDFLPR